MRKIYKNMIYLVLSFFIWFANVFAQNNIQFENIALEEGLSQYSVHTILQDSRGFLWFGTQDGLDRYDGHDFVHFKYKFNDSTSISANNISSIVEDDNGYLWIGTTNGLNKYDPVENIFTRFFHNKDNVNSMSGNEINSLCIDQENNIWVGTNGKGLNKISFKNNQVIIEKYFNQENKKNSISSNIIYDICLDKNGIIWVSTANGLNRYDPISKVFIRYIHNPINKNSLIGNNVSALYVDSKGVIWCGSDYSGLNKLEFAENNYKKPKFVHFTHDENNSGSLTSNRIDVIFEDKNGNLWIGTDNSGLNKLVIKDNKINFEHYMYDISNPNSLANNSIRSIVEGSDGLLWVGTGMGGVSKIKFHKKNFKTYKHEFGKQNSLNNSIVITLYEDTDTNLWVGTLRDGLNKLEKKSNTFTHHLDGKQVDNNINIGICSALWIDKENNFWIGSIGNGIILIKKEGNKFLEKKVKYYFNNPQDSNSVIANYINTIYVSPNDLGTLWLGTDNGLGKYNIKSNLFTSYKHKPGIENSLSDNSVKSISEDENEILWIGTKGGGLNRLDEKRQDFTQFTFDKNDTNSISNNYIRCIHKDNLGNFWLGTDGGGLTKMIKSSDDSSKFIFERYTTDDGLPNNVIYGILEDDYNNLWMSTNRGLSKLNVLTNTFTNFSKRDGLQDDEFNTGAYFKSVTGEMFFGGISGFNSFFPDSVKVEENINKPILTDFQLFFESIEINKKRDDKILLHKAIYETEKIFLDYYENTISIKYSSQFYSDPQRVEYAYKLEGSESNWNYVGNRNFAIYTNLYPGDYVFKVKSSVSNAKWGDDYTSVRIIINPPFWVTWWFRLIIIFIVFGTIFSVFMMRINAIKKHSLLLEKSNKKLNKEIKKRISIETEREKLNKLLKSKNIELEQIVYVSSHDLRSPLINIQGFSKELKYSVEEIVSIIEKLKISEDDKKSLGDLFNEHIFDSLNFINSNVTKMDKLISGLLKYSRLNRKKINPEILNVNIIVKDISNKLSNSITMKKEFDLTFEDLPSCYGDYKQIGEVFSQLLINAISYLSDERKGIIKISGYIKNATSIYKIEDNGIGIDENHKNKIFDIFHKLNPDETTGEGVGLALVRAIILKHGGKIEIESELDKGSTFIISIPNEKS